MNNEPIYPFLNAFQNELYHCENNVLKYAFLLKPGVVEVVFIKEDEFEGDSFELLRWDYSNGNPAQFEMKFVEFPSFEKVEHKILVHISNWDDGLNYVLKCKNEWVNVSLNPQIGGILDTYFHADGVNDFGVRISKNSAKFKVWSPPAAMVEILLFDKQQQLIPTKQPLWMKKVKSGVFSVELSTDILPSLESFNGLFYQYRVFAYGKSTVGVDPYCFSMASFNPNSDDKIGKSAIVDMDDLQALPEGFQKNYSNGKFMANFTDLIAYEAHIRDFTIQPNMVKSEIAGTFLGAIEKIDYLKSLGITHLQLLPVMNFYSVNELDRSFSDSKSRIQNYNWGYDPHHYFSLEGWFSKDANNPYGRIIEFRELAQKLHNHGIGVILDVVYNHTFLPDVFENIAPGCYYRLNDDYFISIHTGAGFTVESRRLMVRKLIIDSLTFFVNEYHVDGFRFDLMGFMDHEIMSLIRKKVGIAYNPADVDELILHGEAWVFSDLDISPKSNGINAATTKINYPKEKLNLGFFNDVARDSFSGNSHKIGYINGDFSQIDKVASAIVGGLKGVNPGAVSFNNSNFRAPYHSFANEPQNCLNFLSVHDGLTLWDKINLQCFDVSGFERARLMKLASAMLFTSQGKIILHGGDELLRTKPLAEFDKERQRAFTSKFVNEEEDVWYFHENSYASSDFTNMIRWSRLNNRYAPIARQMVDYYKGLIQMRRAIPALRFNLKSSVFDSFKFIPSSPEIAQIIPSVFADFKDEKLTNLTLRFILGPAKTRLYLAGEVHDEVSGLNPLQNDFFVDFDKNGAGVITFNKEQISKFDIGGWGDGISLNFKLVATPGKWDFLQGAYSEAGNNVVMIQGISAKGEAVIDLGIKNHWVGITPTQNEPWIAYSIDNLSENKVGFGIQKANFKQVIVIHNASDSHSFVFSKLIQNPDEWCVILDSMNAGITPLPYNSTPKKGETDVLIQKGVVAVPHKSSAVIAR